MCLGVVASDRKKMDPYFFKVNEKIGTEAYYKVLDHLAVVEEELPQEQLHVDTRWCPLSHGQQGADVLQGELCQFLGQDLLAPVIPRPEPSGLQHLEHLRGQGGKDFPSKHG